jgi:hypothetical protein
MEGPLMDKFNDAMVLNDGRSRGCYGSVVEEIEERQ